MDITNPCGAERFVDGFAGKLRVVPGKEIGPDISHHSYPIPFQDLDQPVGRAGGMADCVCDDRTFRGHMCRWAPVKKKSPALGFRNGLGAG
jgi:hypothetical protein